MSKWDWSSKDPLRNYAGNDKQPKLDCAAFVGLVLDIAGITKGTEGRKYPQIAGLNLIGTGNGVRNIIENDLFKDVKSNDVRVGDIAYTGDKKHIMIVSEVKNGKALKFIHSSSWDYTKSRLMRNEKGVQISPFAHKAGIKFKRLK